MDFQAIFDNYKRTITDHYFDMNGRAGRAQFWYFVLANICAAILASIAGAIVRLPLSELYNLAILLPATCLGARRLQDIGRNGMLAWAFLVVFAVTQIIGIFTAFSMLFAGPFGFFFFGPSLGLMGLISLGLAVALIYFWCQPGDPGPNAYGPPPPIFDPNTKPAT